MLLQKHVSLKLQICPKKKFVSVLFLINLNVEILLFVCCHHVVLHYDLLYESYSAVDGAAVLPALASVDL
jgi:hypothetical protein